MKKLILLCFVVSFVILSGSLAYSATSWYFPEGSTQNFDLYILITNPNSSQITANLLFYLEGSTDTYSTTVGANERKTLWINSLTGTTNSNQLNGLAMSVKVTCTEGLNIYAERAMYYPSAYGQSSGINWQIAHTARGASGLEGAFKEISSPSSYPIVISTSGSYKLIENLICSTQDVNAIEITASDVTIDLNGLTITGPGQSTGSSGDGIYADNVKNITIKNGLIQDFRGNGIDILGSTACESTNVLNVTAYNNGEFGIICGIGGTISGCTANNNSGGGLNFYQGGLVKDNTCYNNSGYGIFVNSVNLVTNNVIFTTQDSSTITGDAGIYLRYSNNVLNNASI